MGAMVPPSRKSCYNFRVTEINRVLDGDTIDVTIDLGFDLYKKERVRANEKVVAAIGLLGSVVIAILGTGIFQKAEACSPPLDGSEFVCPPWDDVILEKPVAVSIPEEKEDIPYTHRVTLYDTRVAHMGHSFPTGEWIEKIRDHESRKVRTPVEEMINNTLIDYEYGSNDPTEQEELLQLPSNGD